MESIKKYISTFESISLEEMGESFLLKRYDEKYFFHVKELDRILSLLKSDFKVLEIKGNRIFKYRSTYFDTPDFALYRMHHNRRSNRHKFRFREYVESGKKFFEIKHKQNNKLTDKSRIESHCTETLNQTEVANFIHDNSPYAAEELKSTIVVEYQRISLKHNTKNTRITIDINLSFSNNMEDKDYNALVILEHKYIEAEDRVELARSLSQLNILPNRISKYCLGITQLYSEVKKNLFKQKLRKINKIESYEPTV